MRVLSNMLSNTESDMIKTIVPSVNKSIVSLRSKMMQVNFSDLVIEQVSAMLIFKILTKTLFNMNAKGDPV